MYENHLKYLLDNSKYIDRGLIEDLIKRVNHEFLHKEYHVYVEVKDELIYGTKIKLNLRELNQDKLIAEVKAKLSDIFGDFLTFLEYKDHGSLFNYYFFRHVGNGVFHCTKEYYESNFFYLLRYIFNKHFDEDYAEAHRIIDTYVRTDIGGFKNIPETYDITIAELNNINIKRFKNGKIIIKGLTKEQLSEIDRIASIAEKYRNV
jgi:hypothetical protein